MTFPDYPPPRVGDTVFTDAYYERLAELLGDERADWARLPYAERMKELELLHATFDTPDDLSDWPAELDGGADRP